MEQVLKTVPLTAAVRAAILDHEGAPGQALRAVMACEQMDFDTLRASEIDESTVWKVYFEAVKWATRTQNELQEAQAERV
jgi:c-di-GMP-related signal transduction protein